MLIYFDHQWGIYTTDIGRQTVSPLVRLLVSYVGITIGNLQIYPFRVDH